MQNSRARIPPPQRDCGGWDALVRAHAARVPAPPTLPRLCLEEEASSHATPHAAPLKGGRTRWRRPDCQPFYTRLRRDAVQCCATACEAMLCEAVLCSATLCYDVLLGERIAARLVL